MQYVGSEIPIITYGDSESQAVGDGRTGRLGIVGLPSTAQ
jgi:hypothetical protein